MGRPQARRENKVWLANDLKESLASADKFEVDMVKRFDDYILQAGLNLPPEDLPELRDGYEAEEITELDLHSTGITTIIWSMGYVFDFKLVKLPIVDSDGFPIQKRGVTDHPGLFFVGLPWIYKRKSGHLFGVGEDADFIASVIASEET